MLKDHEVDYIRNRRTKEDIFSKNAYIPKEIEVGGSSYSFYLNKEENYLEVLPIWGANGEYGCKISF